MANNYDMASVNLPRAAMFCLATAFFLSIMTMFVKLAAPYTTNSVTIFFRFMVSFIYVTLILIYKTIRGNPISLKPQKLWLHILRAAFGVASMLCLYYSLKFIPLMDASLLKMTNPLFIPILAIILLGVKTKPKVIISIIIGFLGIILVIRPGLGMVDHHAIYALASGVCTAFVVILLREVAKQDKPQVIMFYYFLFAAVAGGLIALTNWRTPNTHTLMLLLGVGIFGSLYQDCIIRASRYAPASIVSVFLYTTVVFNGILDWLVWGIKPDLCTIVGLMIICGASYFVVKHR